MSQLGKKIKRRRIMTQQIPDEMVQTPLEYKELFKNGFKTGGKSIMNIILHIHSLSVPMLVSLWSSLSLCSSMASMQLDSSCRTRTNITASFCSFSPSCSPNSDPTMLAFPSKSILFPSLPPFSQLLFNSFYITKVTCEDSKQLAV